MPDSRFVTTRDGRRLHYVTGGTGSPTVVFEAGLAANRHTWGLIQPTLSETVRTVAYDRAGLGRSDPDPATRGLARLADDLEDLLTAVDAPPYLLVGHSLGGPIIRLLATLRPDLVAGLVLVDQVAEDCAMYRSRVRTAFIQAGYRAAELLARSGLLALVVSDRLHRQFPPEVRAEMTSEELRPATFATGARELSALPGCLTAMLAHPAALPDVPVTLLSAGHAPLPARRALTILTASHRRLAAALPQGRHVVVPGCGHLIPWDRPTAVITEIQRMLTARRPAPGRPHV
jgi:pimeloyl-ACP methyl ester carboxylesterase